MLLGGFGFILFLISKGNGKSYCERNRNHVLCNSRIPETDGDDLSCQKGLKRFLLSKEDEASILGTVNFYREKVAKGKIPKGSGYSLASPSANMMRAKWDPELAMMASKISNLCKPYQFCEGCLDLVRFPSVFVQSYSVLNEEKYDPFDWRSYIDEIILTKGNSTIRHNTPRSFDLITWAEVYLVGCGLSIFPHEGKTIHNFVCAFGPVVPDDDEEPSVLGLPCSYCPIGSRCLSNMDVLCDCEILCFPFKYVTFRRLRRQDDASGAPSGEADAGAAEASGESGEAGGEGGGGGTEESGEMSGDEGGEKNETDAGAGGDEKEATDGPDGGGGGGGDGDASPGGGEGDMTTPAGEAGTGEAGDPTEGGDDQPVPTKKSTAAHPISISFIIQLFYVVCVSKILK